MGQLRTLDYRIRKASVGDLDQVIQINRRELPENYSSDFFYSLLKDHGDYFFVAECEGKIIGYVMCRMETSFSLGRALGSPLHAKGHVVSLAVDSGFRRVGVGKSLMEAALSVMRQKGVKESYLEVRVDNIPAINLYEKLGYKKTRISDFYYADGTSANVMTLSL